MLVLVLALILALVLRLLLVSSHQLLRDVWDAVCGTRLGWVRVLMGGRGGSREW